MDWRAFSDPDKRIEEGEWGVDKPLKPVELLRHVRHDWLNQIQLIKANLSLNRIERAKEIIEDITARSRNESKLTNLHMPRVAELLLTFNWYEHSYRLQTEVIGREQDLSDYEDDLAAFLSEWLERLDDCAELGAENDVLVSFQLGDDGVFATMDFSGSLKETKTLGQAVRLHKGFQVMEDYISKEAFVLTLKIAPR
ncbi:MAG TPA: Spo0B C-terminal domain-containing protein [Bacillales bacterium]|nr:Spo0B C-terminal domain-containing protein [Bacillales bacterium]